MSTAELLKLNRKNIAVSSSDLSTKVLSNPNKDLSAILGLVITKQLTSIFTDIRKLERLVNETNNLIDQANNSNYKPLFNRAIVARERALNILEKAERTSKRLKGVLDSISRILIVLNLIISIIKKIPIIPPNVVLIIQRIQNLINSLSIILAIILPSLNRRISEIELLKSKLKRLNDFFENETIKGLINGTISLNKEDNIEDIIAGIRQEINSTTVIDEYEGFRFEIKDEVTLGVNKAVIVRGLRRKYAVAIDTNNTEVLRSDASFTLDPTDLVEQLKLIIDQRNLKA